MIIYEFRFEDLEYPITRVGNFVSNEFDNERIKMIIRHKFGLKEDHDVRLNNGHEVDGYFISNAYFETKLWQ